MRHPLAAVIAASTLYALSPSAAHAQVTDGEFSVQRFDPAPGPRNYFNTRGVRTDGEMAWSAGLFVNYGWKPFVVLTCQNVTSCGDPGAIETDVPVVENIVTGDVLGSFTPIERLQIGLKIPVTWVNGQGIDDTGRPVDGGVSAVGMGDAQLEGKFRLHGEVKDPFVVGAGAFVTGPLGRATSEGNYIGDQTPTCGLRNL
jgi:hypothetical protein